jgi:hypothetical protein
MMLWTLITETLFIVFYETVPLIVPEKNPRKWFIFMSYGQEFASFFFELKKSKKYIRRPNWWLMVGGWWLVVGG